MVVAGGILFAIAAYLIGQKQDMFSTTFTLRAAFNNVNGLQAGNNVRLSGINVGSVVSVEIQSDSTIEITLRIKENVRKFIRKDAIASIGTDGLMGNMLVNLNPAGFTAPIVENNDLLPTFSKIKTDDILKTLNVTNENAAMLTSDLLEIIQSIRHGKGTISSLVYDTLLRNQFSMAVYNLKEATQKTTELLSMVQNITHEINQGKGLAGWLAKDTLSKIKVDKMLADLQVSTASLKKSSDSLQVFVNKVNNGAGTIPALMYDTAMANNLRKTLSNLSSGTAKFDENMEALKHNFLTRKYFRQKEKEK
jgi:ABC-type transport system involved in resistance to organic solvents, periplasmic component